MNSIDNNLSCTNWLVLYATFSTNYLTSFSMKCNSTRTTKLQSDIGQGNSFPINSCDQFIDWIAVNQLFDQKKKDSQSRTWWPFCMSEEGHHFQLISNGKQRRLGHCHNKKTQWRPSKVISLVVDTVATALNIFCSVSLLSVFYFLLLFLLLLLVKSHVTTPTGNLSPFISGNVDTINQWLIHNDCVKSIRNLSSI